MKSLREARAELLAPLLVGRAIPITRSTYDEFHREVALSRKEVQEAIDDLVSDGRATVDIDGRQIVVRGIA